MTPAEAQQHMEDIRNELSLHLFHEQTLIREIELHKQKFESTIARPKTIKNVSSLTKDQLEIDVVPCNLANKDIIEARKAFYYATMELAQVKVNILAKKDLFNTYKAHMKQEFEKEAKPISDDMIYGAFSKVRDLKDRTNDEQNAFTDINNNLMKYLNSGKEKRRELYETLNNILLQHGIL